MKKLIFGIFLLLTSISHAQTIKKYFWSTFEGTIGESEVVLNIYCDEDGMLSGDYCYKKYEKRIELKGKLNGNSFFLDEFLNNKINAKFNGKVNEENNTISGKWSSTQNSDISFSVRLISQTGGDPINRYGIATKEETENFVAKIKTSVINDDKTWLSKNIKYPITVSVSGKKTKIKTAKDFIAKYPKIVNTKYKNHIQKSCICEIFSNWRGSMFANGLIWINQLDSDSLKITAINN